MFCISWLTDSVEFLLRKDTNSIQPIGKCFYVDEYISPKITFQKEWSYSTINTKVL